MDITRGRVTNPNNFLGCWLKVLQKLNKSTFLQVTCGNNLSAIGGSKYSILDVCQGAAYASTI